MDLEDQGTIKKAVEDNGRENLVVVLGSPDAESAEIYAETVTKGDPTFAGPLAGVPLGLPVYHILEDRIKELVDPETYQQQVGMMEFVLNKEAITAAMAKIRQQ
jgi:glycine/sarcosine/betaine reductase complex component A